MNVLLLGGTGAMGSFLTSILSQQGDVIYVTSRKQRQSSENVIYIKGDAHNFDFFCNIIKSKHWGCIIDFMNYTTLEFKKRYTLLLTNSEQFIYLSSSRVYANSEILKESSPRLLNVSDDLKYLSTDDYALAKARQEDLLLNSKYSNYTIVRPYMTYFSNRLDLGFYPKELWLYRVFHHKKILFPKDVACHYTTLTYGKDVAVGIASLVGNKKALGGCYHITQNKSHTWQYILDLYVKVLKESGYDCNIEYINTDKCYEYINIYDRQFDRQFDNSHINEFIDNTSFIPIEEGIRQSVTQFIEKPFFQSTDYRIYAHWDKLLGERTNISEIKGLKSKLLYIIFRYIISFPFLRKIKTKIK